MATSPFGIYSPLQHLDQNHLSANVKQPPAMVSLMPTTHPLPPEFNLLSQTQGFKQLPTVQQAQVKAFLTQCQDLSLWLKSGLLQECIQVIPPQTLSEILQEPGAAQRLQYKAEDLLSAGSLNLDKTSVIKRYLKAQGTLEKVAERLIQSGHTEDLVLAKQWLADAQSKPLTLNQQTLNISLALQESLMNNQQQRQAAVPDVYEFVLLNDQFTALVAKAENLQQANPGNMSLDLLVCKSRTAQLNNQLYLASRIQEPQRRDQEILSLKAELDMTLQHQQQLLQARLGETQSQQNTLQQRLEQDPILQPLTRPFSQLESEISQLQTTQQQLQQKLNTTTDFWQKRQMQADGASNEAQLLAKLEQKQSLGLKIQQQLAPYPETQAAFRQLQTLRREGFRLEDQLNASIQQKAELNAISDPSLLAQALQERQQDALKLSFRDGMTFQSVRGILTTMLNHKADRGMLSAEIRLGASALMLGDVYFMGGLKLEAESDNVGRIVLSFAGYGGVAGRSQIEMLPGKLPGALALKTEYVFENTEDATRFILESMNRYDPAFIDFVQDVKGPVQGPLPAPGIYTRDNYKVIPVTLEVGTKMGNKEIKGTVNYENLTYQTTGKYYESKIDVMAECGGVGATLTLEWEQHAHGKELKDTPYYGSAVEFKIDLVNFNGKGMSTKGLTDALMAALSAAQNKFELTPELLRQLRQTVQQSADKAVAEAQRQLATLEATPTLKTRLNETSASVEGEISSKLLIRFPFGRDPQGQLYLSTPQLGLDNKFLLSTDGRIPLGDQTAFMAGFEVKADLRKMLTTEKVSPAPEP